MATATDHANTHEVEEPAHRLREHGREELGEWLGKLLPGIPEDEFNDNVNRWEFRLWLDMMLQEEDPDLYQKLLDDEVKKLKSWYKIFEPVVGGPIESGESLVWEQLCKLDGDISEFKEDITKLNQESLEVVLREMVEKLDPIHALWQVDITSLAAYLEARVLEEAVDSPKDYDGYNNYLDYINEDIDDIRLGTDRWLEPTCPGGQTGEQEFMDQIYHRFLEDTKRQANRGQLRNALQNIVNSRCPSGHEFSYINVSEFARIRERRIWEQSYREGLDLDKYAEACRTECADLNRWLVFWDDAHQGTSTGEDEFREYYNRPYESQDATTSQLGEDFDNDLLEAAGWYDDQPDIAEDPPGDAGLESPIHLLILEPCPAGDQDGIDNLDNGDVSDCTGFPDAPPDHDVLLEDLIKANGVTAITSDIATAEPLLSKDQTSTFASTTIISSFADVAPSSPEDKTLPSAPTISSRYPDPMLTSTPTVSSWPLAHTSNSAPILPVVSGDEAPTFVTSNQFDNNDEMDDVQQQAPQVPAPTLSAANGFIDIDMSEVVLGAPMLEPAADTIMEDEMDRNISAPESNDNAQLSFIVPRLSIMSPFLKGENPFASVAVPELAAKDPAPTTYFSSVPRPQTEVPIRLAQTVDTSGNTSKWWSEQNETTSLA
jgi:hypothetical protein